MQLYILDPICWCIISLQKKVVSVESQCLTQFEKLFWKKPDCDRDKLHQSFKNVSLDINSARCSLNEKSESRKKIRRSGSLMGPAIASGFGTDIFIIVSLLDICVNISTVLVFQNHQTNSWPTLFIWAFLASSGSEVCCHPPPFRFSQFLVSGLLWSYNEKKAWLILLEQ